MKALKLFAIFETKKTVGKTNNFFELSSEEKKKMLKKSAIKANEMQADLMSKHQILFAK